MLSWVEEKETELRHKGPIATSLDDVREQLDDLKSFTDTVHPKSRDVQTLNQTAKDLIRDSPSDQSAAVVKEPIGDVNRRWDVLIDSIATRKSDLQKALLHLGAFDAALSEIMEWLARVNGQLDDMPPTGGDPRIIEIELAKLRVRREAHYKASSDKRFATFY